MQSGLTGREKTSYTKIKVMKGEEYQAREEDIYEENLYFSRVYHRARVCLNEILETGAIGAEDQSDHKRDCCFNEQGGDKPAPRFSNILSFCADRGQGKTTAMVSFSKALRELDNRKDEKLVAGFWKGTNVAQYHYEVIDSIDPTAMEEGDSILMMVLSRMFFHFKQICNQNYGREDSSESARILCQRDILIHSFQKCFHDWRVLNTPQASRDFEIEDELEHIMDLGDSSNLRNTLYKLISNYLSFVSPKHHGILVLQIDDADLNVDRVYDILEDIRKYLHLPNVIILLAANMQQMEATVEQYFFKKYKVSLRESTSMVDARRCHKIAEQYLEKLLPKPLRVYLPELNLGDEAAQEGKKGIRVYYQVDLDREEVNLLDDAEGYSKSRESKWRYQKQLLNFLHRKTGLIFEEPKGYLHNFLPATMRELTHFLAYFDKLPDVPIGYREIISYYTKESALTDLEQETLGIWKDNLRQLERYLVDMWAPVNLHREGRALFQEWTEQPQENRHRYLLHILPGYYASERMAMDKEQGGIWQSASDYRKNFLQECAERGVYIEESLSRERREKHEHVYATYADVVTALNVLTDLPGGNFQYKFCYAIEFYYSICAHVLILEHIENNGNIVYSNEEGSSGEHLPNSEVLGNSQVVDFVKSIPDPFGDIPFRMGKINDTRCHIAFWHLSLDASNVYELFSERQTDLAAYAFLQRNLRVEKETALHYVTKPLDLFWQADSYQEASGLFESARNVLLDDKINLEKLKGTLYLFNPFYFLWEKVYNLLERGGKHKRRDSQWEWDPEGLELAMILLLNWDVQKRLSHEFKPLSSEGWTDLSTEMEQLFGSPQMRSCFQDVAEVNHLFLKAERGLLPFPQLRADKEYYLLLQASFPEGKRRLILGFYEKAKELISEAEQEFGPDRSQLAEAEKETLVGDFLQKLGRKAGEINSWNEVLKNKMILGRNTSFIGAANELGAFIEKNSVEEILQMQKDENAREQFWKAADEYIHRMHDIFAKYAERLFSASQRVKGVDAGQPHLKKNGGKKH